MVNLLKECYSIILGHHPLESIRIVLVNNLQLLEIPSTMGLNLMGAKMTPVPLRIVSIMVCMGCIVRMSCQFLQDILFELILSPSFRNAFVYV